MEKIFYSIKNKKFKTVPFANHIIFFIKSGDIKVKRWFPPLSVIHMATGIALGTVVAALKILEERGYIETKNGRGSFVKNANPNRGEHTDEDHVIYANYHCKRTSNLTDGLNRNFNNFKSDHIKETVPAFLNCVYDPFIATFCSNLNRLQNTFYKPDNLYYVHDYQFLIRLVVKLLKGFEGAVVIPKGGYYLIKQTLTDYCIDVFEVSVDRDGFCVSELAEICAKHRVSAIFITSIANYPDTINTTLERLKMLFNLRKIHSFKIIENNINEPWVKVKSNPILKLAGDAINSVIYISPISYLQEGMSRIFYVAGATDLIDQIVSMANYDGIQAYQDIAYAANKTLRSQLYVKTVGLVEQEVDRFMLILVTVFSAAGVWKVMDMSLEKGPVIYLEPKTGRFHADAYEMLKKLHIQVIDPINYPSNDGIKGLRLDFSCDIDKLNLKALENMEMQLRTVLIAF